MNIVYRRKIKNRKTKTKKKTWNLQMKIAPLLKKFIPQEKGGN